jgi:hypothetical protein
MMMATWAGTWPGVTGVVEISAMRKSES